MKIFATLGLLVALLIVGAFIYIAVSDAPVAQTTITKEVPAGGVTK